MDHGIAVIGCGFGGVAAIKALRRANASVPITLIAPTADFVYYPSLIWIPTGLRRGPELKVSLARFLARHRVRHVPARVQGLAAAGREVVTDAGNIANDGLIIASGARALRKLPGIEHSYSICSDIAEAERLRDRLQSLESGRLAFGFAGNPAEPAAMRGGPIFEMLFGVDTWLRRQRRRERFEWTFFAPTSEPGKRLGDATVTRLLTDMRRRGIHIHLGHKLVRFEPGGVVTEGGRIDSDLTVFLAGLSGPEWAAGSPLPLSPGGFIRADGGGRVEGYERVYVAGDAGNYPGPDWMPKQGHMADIQGRSAARNLLDEIAGKAPAAKAEAELVCIIDTLDGGTLVSRKGDGGSVRTSRMFHYAKRAFEWWYLRGLR